MIEIEPSGFVRGARGCSIFEPPGTVVPQQEDEDRNECSSSSVSGGTSTTSSIGKNSDLSEDEEENEVQSAFNGGGGILGSMEALEEVLPIRRGMSKFYNGKSKSFTSLADASSSPSIKDIAKPDDAYNKRRRNLLAFNVWEKSRSFLHQSNGGRISKRPISSSRSTLALAVAMSSSESISSASEDSNSSLNSKSPPRLPPLHPRSKASSSNLSSLPSTPKNISPWRSLSLADLQHCATASTNSLKCSSVCDETDH